MAEEQHIPATAQLEQILALYRKANTVDERHRQQLADEIGKSRLPRYHKEVLMATLLAKTSEEVTLALHLIRNQELLRHADALNMIERKVLAERLKKISQ